VQQRVDFELEGPGVWRGGYNSGKVKSINHPYLDLEAGINRVAVRATRTAGKVTLRAKSAGLKSAVAVVEAKSFAAHDCLTVTLPAMPGVALPANAPRHPNLVAGVATKATAQVAAAMLGRFIKTMNYTGPSSGIVHVETGLAAGRNAYVDRDSTFAAVPAELAGADWIQVADADQRYSAVDLIELAVKGGTVVTIAHDPQAGVPAWLAKQFQPTGRSLAVAGRELKLYTRAMAQDGSLTFGSNSEGGVAAAMYLVFVNAAR
jgi:beta-galactosidase